MKKIMVLLAVVVVWTLAFANTREMQLDVDLAHYVGTETKKIYRRHGIKKEDINWMGGNWVYPGSISIYPIYLEAGNIYIIYGMTTGRRMDGRSVGPKFQGCIGRTNTHRKRREICSKIGRKFTFKFTVKTSGKYYYYARGKSWDGKGGTGLQNSYTVQLYKKDSEIQKRQECYIAPEDFPYCK